MSVLRSLPEVNGGSHPGLPFWHPRLNCQMLHPYTPPATNAGGNELESCLTLLRTLYRRCFCGRCATCSFRKTKPHVGRVLLQAHSKPGTVRGSDRFDR